MRWFQLRRAKFVYKMSFPELSPPSTTRGMTVLNREAFSRRVRLPHLLVDCHLVSRAKPVVKPFLLKLENFRPVVDAESDEENSETKRRKIFLDPTKCIDRDGLTKCLDDVGVSGLFGESEVTLTYANWKYKEILDTVIPSDVDSVSGYSRIGHILHLNLRDELAEYKHLIGEVLLDKVPNIRTVVNKCANINSTYRNFEMEILAGSPDLKVEVVENGCRFAFDFAKVYWNPRLSTEHARILQLLKPDDVVVDVFAGVGPFAVPAAKKRCKVHANDLNPDAYAYLVANASKNRVTYESFNMDGREFIKTEGARLLRNHWKENSDIDEPPHVHFLMNLPAIAVEFLDVFVGLMSGSGWNAKQIGDEDLLPYVHVYCFIKGLEDMLTAAVKMVEEHVKFSLSENPSVRVVHVRSVAPLKEMVRVTFKVPKEVLFRRDSELVREDEEVKKRNVEA